MNGAANSQALSTRQSIVVDVVNHAIDLVVEDVELERRRLGLKHPDPRYTTGVLAKYARLVTGAERGAVTEP